MKKHSIIFALLVLSFASMAQVKDSIPKSYELKEPQYSAMRKIEQEWFSKEYGKILKENKLKMNCNSCESIFMNTLLIESAAKLR
ncbi:MAG: hypothetical protein H0W73_12125 [Bacteroidetes bacterium]|nr:hypothetical protein [Bacteroidota bacterium]